MNNLQQNVWLGKVKIFLFEAYPFNLLWQNGCMKCLDFRRIRSSSSKGVDSAIFHYFSNFFKGVAKFLGFQTQNL